METNTIVEISVRIKEMKLFLASGIYTEELTEFYKARIEALEAKIDMIKCG
jgi:hypothetical protein